jgi:hypothetical protein
MILTKYNKGTWDAFERVAKEEGVLAFYSGLKASLIGIAASNTVYFYWYVIFFISASPFIQYSFSRYLLFHSTSGAERVLVWIEGLSSWHCCYYYLALLYRIFPILSSFLYSSLIYLLFHIFLSASSHMILFRYSFLREHAIQLAQRKELTALESLGVSTVAGNSFS